MKSSVAYKTLDNITVVMLAFKNFKKSLQDEFCQVNGIAPEDETMRETGAAVIQQETQSGTDDKRVQPPGMQYLNKNSQATGQLPLENNDSSNGGL